MFNKYNPKQILKIFSILFLILALVDVSMFVIDLIHGRYAVDNIASPMDINGIEAYISIILTIALALLLVAFEVSLGIIGLRRANGLGQGRGHITISGVALVTVLICLVINAAGVIAGIVGNTAVDWRSVISSAVSLIIIKGYRDSAKRCM